MTVAVYGINRVYEPAPDIQNWRSIVGRRYDRNIIPGAISERYAIACGDVGDVVASVVATAILRQPDILAIAQRHW